jgi:SAM-dependent methyltransferase
MALKKWDDLSGDWQGLMSSDQAGRYQAIARAVESNCPTGAVLDVGCGEAVLREFLPQCVEYTGIEPSLKAASLALNKPGPLRIIHGRCEDVDLRGRTWDCIVFNEVLYYLADPIGLITKYSQLVARGGIVIASIFQKPESPSLKARLLHAWDPRRPISNVHCTEQVRSYMIEHAWAITQDVLIPGADANHYWRLIVARPSV